MCFVPTMHKWFCTLGNHCAYDAYDLLILFFIQLHGLCLPSMILSRSSVVVMLDSGNTKTSCSWVSSQALNGDQCSAQQRAICQPQYIPLVFCTNAVYMYIYITLCFTRWIMHVTGLSCYWFQGRRCMVQQKMYGTVEDSVAGV